MATNDSSQSSLTSWLRTQHGDALDTATHHPFLQAAGAGTLPERELCTWLVQDKYYQFAYVNFIGRLIAKVDLTSYAFPNKEETNLEWKTFEVLIGALIAIKEEILFYNRTVESYGLEVEEADPDSVTRAYVKLFEESSTEGTPLLHGLTVLWATEYVYHQAWSYAKTTKGKTDVAGHNVSESAAIAIRDKFIPNWTSEEFEAAVQGIAYVADAWSRLSHAENSEECRKLWKKVLDLETEFWPRPSAEVVASTHELIK